MVAAISLQAPGIGSAFGGVRGPRDTDDDHARGRTKDARAIRGRGVSDGPSYGTLCSGVEGFGRGFEQAGFGAPRFFCEANPFRRRVLERHWPGVPCHHDLTTLDAGELAAVDVLAAGTPCPDFSHAKANRQGLEGSKSRLFWDFARIRNALSPEWTVWENVDGALTSNQGLDFALVLGAFVGADVHVPRGGWACAGVVTGPWGGAVWRVLDAQHFGTPQRRHRVFVVGCLGGPCPPEILFDPAGGSRDLAASDPSAQDAARAFGVRVAGTLGALTGGVRTTELGGEGAYVAAGEPVVSVFRKAQKAHHGQDAERWEPTETSGTLAAGGGDANGTLIVPFDVTTAEGESPTGARQTSTARTLRAGNPTDDAGTVLVEVAATLTGSGNGRVDPLEETAVLLIDGVRRLTPTECERIQGFPDGWTIPDGLSLRDASAWHQGADVEAEPVDPDRLDTPRRSAMGDAVDAAVSEWIGRRLIVSWRH